LGYKKKSVGKNIYINDFIQHNFAIKKAHHVLIVKLMLSLVGTNDEAYFNLMLICGRRYQPLDQNTSFWQR
jgi:hypothetical protein